MQRECAENVEWILLPVGKKWRTAPQKNCRPTVGQRSADSRTTVDQQSDNSRRTVGQLSFTAFYENLLPVVSRLLAVCRPHVGNLLAKCRLRTLVKYQKSLSSQGRTLHIDAKWNFLTWVRHIVLVFLGTNLLAIPSHHPRFAVG